ncbi:MAG: hypothetical protein GY793_01865 [Proteobacteria bacterium]|nr:hypothetical protein [Pseudomonadota bacterium]
MRTCEICGISIELYHRSSKYCTKHKPHKFNPVPREETVPVNAYRLQQLIRDSEQLKKIKECMK